jgi:hypothetical protein
MSVPQFVDRESMANVWGEAPYRCMMACNTALGRETAIQELGMKSQGTYYDRDGSRKMECAYC